MHTAYIVFDGKRWFGYSNPEHDGFYEAYATTPGKLEILLRRRGYTSFVLDADIRVRFEQLSNASLVETLGMLGEALTKKK